MTWTTLEEMRISSCFRDIILPVLTLAAAVAVLWGTPVLAQETVVVRVKLIQGEVPTDPLAPIWNMIPATEFPTSPQVHWPKRILQVTVNPDRILAESNYSNNVSFVPVTLPPTAGIPPRPDGRRIPGCPYNHRENSGPFNTTACMPARLSRSMTTPVSATPRSA